MIKKKGEMSGEYFFFLVNYLMKSNIFFRRLAKLITIKERDPIFDYLLISLNYFLKIFV